MAANHCDAIALALDRHDSRIRDAEREAKERTAQPAATGEEEK